MSIEAMKRNEVADAGLGGDAEITDLIAQTTFTVRISVSKTYHHSDFMPKTQTDAVKMKSILGKWSWGQNGGDKAGVRPTLMEWSAGGKKHATAGAIHLMPHDENIYGKYAFYIGGDASLRQGGQANYGHFCCHYIDSLALRAKGEDDWNRAMHNMVIRAVEILGGAAPAPLPQSRPTLKKGSGGQFVVTLQIALNAFGASLVVDGDFWNLTDAAVRAFQKAQGLAVDGVVGPDTWKALDGVEPTPAPDAPTTKTYMVAAGDTLSKIAARYNTTTAALAQINGLANPNLIRIGQILKIA